MLIGNSAEFENDATMNRDPLKILQKLDRKGKRRRLCNNISKAVLETLKFKIYLYAML